ncbi:MAG: phosphomannomutase [Candidatus Binatia bacterium]
MVQPSFLEYAPVPLAFGTSGLRGLVTDITDLEAYINVKAALRYLVRIGDIHEASTVVLGGDLRPSTDRIMRACAQAIIDSGYRMENAGKIPTPALIAHAVSTKRAGVMVSGSHIPFDRNGIKPNKSVGEILKSDESGIIQEVALARAEEYSRSAKDSAFDAAGMLKRAPDLAPLDRAAEEAYVHRFTRSFKGEGLTGWRVLVYQHSAVGRDILPRILGELGAEVVTAGRSETFVPIDTENITDEQLTHLEGLATAAKASGQPLNAIVSTDGDSDRPLVTAVLSDAEIKPGGKRVRFLPGDLLGIVAAEYLRADAVAVPISANDAVDRRMKERGVSLLKTKIGSPYVVSALDELRRTEKFARIVGWEANGGFLTASDIQLSAGMLPALPTRDSTLPILATLFAAAEQGIGLSTLWDRLPARFGRAGLLDNVSIAASQAILARLIPSGNVIEVEFDGSNRVLDCSETTSVRVLLGEPVSKKWQESKAILSSFFDSALGFGEIVRLNVLDGVRIYFRNSDIVHIRPSGNAPQLRIYAVSDSQARADEIVSLAVREPDGVLRQLERAFT